MEKIRTFVAISLTPSLISRLDILVSEMRSLARGVRWVKPQSVHLTLKFLGNLTSKELERVFTGMEIAEKKYPEPFSIRVQGTGCFPSERRPRIFWVGLGGEDIHKLNLLQEITETELASQGFPAETRPFKPHLTVARLKDDRGLSVLLNKFLQFDFPPVELPIEEIQVMRSELKPEGAVYSVQKTYKLKDVD